MFKQLKLENFDALWEIETAAHAFPWSAQTLKDQLKKEGRNFAWLEENILKGFICLQKIFPEAEILNVAVHPKYQRQGIGKKLLSEVLKKLALEKFERVFLEVRESNLPAIRLYEALGFNQFGERKNYYPGKKGREDALLFAKEF